MGRYFAILSTAEMMDTLMDILIEYYKIVKGNVVQWSSKVGAKEGLALLEAKQYFNNTL